MKRLTRRAVAAAALMVSALLMPAAFSAKAPEQEQPSLGYRKLALLPVNSLNFKDLNRNGRLDKYEDWRLSPDERAGDLVSKMTLQEKAGLMVHANLVGFTGPNGTVLDEPVRRPQTGPDAGPPPGTRQARPSPRELILRRHVRWLLVRPNPSEPPEATARFSNGIQEIAESSRLGIPAVFSSDPRHSTRRGPLARPGESSSPPNISRWPEPIAFAAIGDPNVVREFGRIAAREYRALGIHVALSPMADVATEPRWYRIPGTFGEDAELAALLVKAYVRGFQGRKLGPESVMCVTKHWPGDGPVKDGLDPHNDYGKWQVYPGENFDYHLIPFQAAFEAGTGGVMPGYAIPLGVDTVGMNYSKIIVNNLLRKKYGFDGLVVTDWLSAMPWGVESLTPKERHRLIIEAGGDQLGGESDPGNLLGLVREGTIAEARLDESARRILRPMFQLGLFENPYVEPEHARTLVASSDFMRAGESAQRRSVVLLKNEKQLLPLSGRPKIYVMNLSPDAAARRGVPVDDPSLADIAMIKVDAPYSLRRGGGFFARRSKEGTLAYAGAENAGELDAIKRLAASGTPTIVFMYMDRPAILTEFIDDVAAVLAHFGSSDDVLVDVAFRRSGPRGKLPFNLPRDMASVRGQKEDVPHDLENPLFRFGFGATYGHSR